MKKCSIKVIYNGYESRNKTEEVFKSIKDARLSLKSDINVIRSNGGLITKVNSYGFTYENNDHSNTVIAKYISVE